FMALSFSTVYSQSTASTFLGNAPEYASSGTSCASRCSCALVGVAPWALWAVAVSDRSGALAVSATPSSPARNNARLLGGDVIDGAPFRVVAVDSWCRINPHCHRRRPLRTV